MKALANAKLKKIINEFPQRKESTSLLVEISPEDSLEAQLVLTKSLTDRGFKVVIVSGGRPCFDLISLHNKEKINAKTVHIIDLICKNRGINVKDSPTVTHMRNIRSLTEISIYLSGMIVPQKTILLIDSLTSMLLYSHEATLIKFLSNTLRKMKDRGVHLILIFINTQNHTDIHNELTYLCDVKVKL